MVICGYLIYLQGTKIRSFDKLAKRIGFSLLNYFVVGNIMRSIFNGGGTFSIFYLVIAIPIFFINIFRTFMR